MQHNQKEWVLTQQAFNKLLSQINPNLEIAALKYNEIYQKTVNFFECKDCNFSEDYADEVVKRVITKIDEGEVIASENMGKYFYSVAQNVLKEYRRKKQRQPQSLEDLPVSNNLSIDPHEVEQQAEQTKQKEKQLECLDMCLQKMEPNDSELIYLYYQHRGREGIQNREAIAQKMGISITNLRVKMHRLREKLEQCVNNCLTI